MKRLSVKKMRAPGPTRRVTVGFRVSESVRHCLQDAADKNARSLSQEAEHRLEESFSNEEIVKQALALAYGEDVARAMFTIADSIRSFRTVRELPGMGEANRKAVLDSFSQGLHGLIDNLLGETVK
jgi:ribosomal protein S13